MNPIRCFDLQNTFWAFKLLLITNHDFICPFFQFGFKQANNAFEKWIYPSCDKLANLKINKMIFEYDLYSKRNEKYLECYVSWINLPYKCMTMKWNDKSFSFCYSPILCFTSSIRGKGNEKNLNVVIFNGENFVQVRYCIYLHPERHVNR